MASITLASKADTFGVGTTVYAYPASSFPLGGGGPFGNPVTSGVVQPSGSVTFVGLEASTAYRAYANGQTVSFRTEPATSGGSGEGVSLADTVTFERTASMDLSSPIEHSVLTGEFVPEGESVWFDVDISHACLQPMLWHAGWEVFYGQADDSDVLPTPLLPAAQNDDLESGVVRKRLGALGGYAGGAGGKLALTGLVPGRRVSFELAVAITGGEYQIDTPGSPESVSVSNFVPAFLSQPPEQAQYVALRTSSPHEVRVYRCRMDGAITDLGSVSIPTSTYGEVAIQKPATTAKTLRFACTSYDDHSVTVGVVDLAAGTVTLQAKYTVPGTTPGPIGCSIDPTGTYAWIGCIGTNRVFRMTLADGTFSSAINPGVTLVNQTRVSPDGAYVYVQGSAIVKLDAASFSVLGTSPAITAAGGITVTPDGSEVYCVAGGFLRRIRTSDMTALTPGTLISTAYRIDVFPDGKSVWVASNSAGAVAQAQHYKIPSMTNYVNTFDGADSTATGVAIGEYGDIFFARKAAKKLRWWPGGRVYFVNDDFWSHVLRVRVTGATAAS
jgi:hypothetical protein